MKEKQLFQKLRKNYKKVDPKTSWVNKARSDLLYFARTNITVESKQMSKPHIFPALGLAVLLLLLVPVSAIWAKESKPGDIVYPVKRFWEEVRVVTALSSETKEMLREAQAVERLEELSELLDENEKYYDKVLSEIEKSVVNILDSKDGNIDCDKRFEKAIKELSKIEEKLEDGKNKKRIEKCISKNKWKIKGIKSDSVLPEATNSADLFATPSSIASDEKDEEKHEKENQKDKNDQFLQGASKSQKEKSSRGRK